MKYFTPLSLLRCLLILNGYCYCTLVDTDFIKENHVSGWSKAQLALTEPEINLRAVTDIDQILKNASFCSICDTALSIIYSSAKKGEPLPLIKIKIVSICVSIKIQTREICTGIVDTFIPTIVEAFRISPSTPKEICSMIFNDICPAVNNTLHEWKIRLPDVSKPVVKVEELPPTSSKLLKVLQLNDIHLDVEYSEESNGNCGEPVCCRKSSTVKKQVIFPAGRWGHYTCDPPEKMVESMLQSIAKQHPDIDYIMLLGDLLPHDMWNQTQQKTLISIERIMSLIKRIFPNTLVLPNAGNHDVTPMGSYAPPWVTNPKYSTTWLYTKLYDLWKDWIPDSEEATVLLGGFYSVIVRPGFRVISINTNFCNIFNWWLYANSADPAEQLEWLIQILRKAETNKEKVHIIGHMPPGSSECLKVWSRNYYTIVNRYESTIAAQFFAHSHLDEFEIFYDLNNSSRPISVGYIAPSVTPYWGFNPAYRIYYVDGDRIRSTRTVVNHETWIMDLDKANNEVQKTPEWVKFYSAKEAYNMSNLRPTEWNKLIYSMRENSKVFDIFYNNYHRDSPVSKKYNNRTRLDILCNLKSAKSHDRNETCSEFNTL